MPIHIYWGEDDFKMEKAIADLRDEVLDASWSSFNYTTFPPDHPNAAIEALNQAMTPPFGTGGRLVWLMNTNIAQQSDSNVLSELQRTLSVIPDNSYLLITSRNKPDERLKSTKLLKKFAQIREFGLISPFKTDLLKQSVNDAANSLGIKLTSSCADFLVEAVGNDTRLLYNELQKLQLYLQGSNQILDVDTASQLVKNSTQNSLQLAGAIRMGDTAKALSLVADLMSAYEPSLRIVATLIGQFRTWLWVRIMMETGERNPQAIASAAEIRNHFRVKYLQQEIRFLSVQQLISCLPILLELEVNLKQGSPQTLTLQTKVIELCQICQKS
ncbi:MAG: DNA polymerase III subunit delta [Cyanobacteriota bacterium]|nr:DNA polymerase III subunit delta [Cyanobacteriota bacterium]